jgi:hypothetical protein
MGPGASTWAVTLPDVVHAVDPVEPRAPVPGVARQRSDGGTTTTKADLSVYIGFDGQARQALTYHQGALGGDLELETFGAYGMAPVPADEEKILYGVPRDPTLTEG